MEKKASSKELKESKKTEKIEKVATEKIKKDEPEKIKKTKRAMKSNADLENEKTKSKKHLILNKRKKN